MGAKDTKDGLAGAAPVAGAQADEKTMGSGAEAARGLHGKQGRDESAGSGSEASGSSRGDADRLGSEPLERDREHKGSYGGEGGAPRTSSDKREPQTPE